MTNCAKPFPDLLWSCLISGTAILLSGCYDYRPLSGEISSPGTQASRSSPQETEAEQKASLAVKSCTEQFPETAGRKALQVRCIVTATDAIWDKASPQGSEARHALGSYAIQLAEREDRGEITREQAENLYMQFLQQTPGMGIPPKTSP
jgi:hypothetical protein